MKKGEKININAMKSNAFDLLNAAPKTKKVKKVKKEIVEVPPAPIAVAAPVSLPAPIKSNPEGTANERC